VGVLVFTFRAHREFRHAGAHSVVRHAVKYGRARPA
jgi:hypothetical protein